MSFFEITFNTDAPELRAELAEIGRMPRNATRLRVEAAICQWWANRCLEQAGALEWSEKRDRRIRERAAATRSRNQRAAQ